MDEFLNNNLPEEEDEQEVSQNAEEKDFEPIYNPVNYTEVKPIEDYSL